MGVYGVEIDCPLCGQKHPAIFWSAAVGTSSAAYTSYGHAWCEQRVFLLRTLVHRKRKVEALDV